MNMRHGILSAAALAASIVSLSAFAGHHKLRGTGQIYTFANNTCLLHPSCKATTTTGGSCTISAPVYNGLTACMIKSAYTGHVKTVD
jgi:hypothetical protein